MKFQHFLMVAFAFAATTTLTSCADNTIPTVTIDLPLDGATVATGSTVTITGVVEDKKELEEAVVEVTNAANDSLLYELVIPASGTKANVSTTYVVNMPAGSHLEVHLEATDKAGNSNDTHAHLTVN